MAQRRSARRAQRYPCEADATLSDSNLAAPRPPALAIEVVVEEEEVVVVAAGVVVMALVRTLTVRKARSRPSAFKLHARAEYQEQSSFCGE